MKKIIQLAAIFAAINIQAATISFTNQSPNQLTDWTNSVSLPKFNQNLGTLQSVDVVIISHAEGTVSIKNRDNIPREFNASLQGTLNFDIENTLFGSLSAGTNFSIVLAERDYVSPEFEFIGPSAVVRPFTSTTTNVYNIPSAYWSLLSDGIKVNFQAFAFQSISGSADVYDRFTHQSGATVSVTYTYKKSCYYDDDDDFGRCWTRNYYCKPVRSCFTVRRWCWR
jgi:hypothetical protein